MLAYIYPLISDNYILKTNSVLFTFYKRENKLLFSINRALKKTQKKNNLGVVFSKGEYISTVYSVDMVVS